MTLRLFIDSNIPGVEQMLSDRVHVQRFHGRQLTTRDLRNADALFVRSVTRVDEDLLRDTNIRFVGSATSGFDHVDLDYLVNAGIAYTHAAGANANSVVEYVLAAISACQQKLEQLMDGGVLGIVGHGHVGKLLAERCAALGIATLVYDPWLAPLAITNPATLKQVLGCDVVSLHCSLTHRLPHPSFHLLGEVELSQLQPGALLINASRGAVLDNAALTDFVMRRDDVQVVLDVWEGEPEINTDLLQRVALGTAHIAGYSYDGKLRATRTLVDALTEHNHQQAFGANCEAVNGSVRAAQRNEIPAPEVVRIGEPATNAQIVRTLLQQCYDIEQDDELLRDAIAAIHCDDRAKAFDGLRRDYRQRRELWGSRVIAPALPAEHHWLLQALGCEVVK